MEKKNKNKSKIYLKNPTEGELKKQLDLYSSGDEKQFFAVKKIEQAYQKTKQAEQKKRITADVHYAQGLRTGLRHAPYEQLQYERTEKDQAQRNQVLEDARVEYRRHKPHSKRFNKEVFSNSPSQRIVKFNRVKWYREASDMMKSFNAKANHQKPILKPNSISNDFNKAIAASKHSSMAKRFNAIAHHKTTIINPKTISNDFNMTAKTTQQSPRKISLMKYFNKAAHRKTVAEVDHSISSGNIPKKAKNMGRNIEL